MFAVIKTGGKQLPGVAANDVLTIEKLEGARRRYRRVQRNPHGRRKAPAQPVGLPFVEGAMVVAEVVEQGPRPPKVIAFKKRRRQKELQSAIRGHRQHQTVVRITDILTGGAKPAPRRLPAKKEAAPKADAAATTEAATSNAAPLFTAPAGEPDNLTKIKGIGPVAASQLNEQGITTFAQVAALSDAGAIIARIDEAMPFPAPIKKKKKNFRTGSDQAKALAE